MAKHNSRFFLTILVLFIAVPLYSQKIYSPGYVVMNNGDTLHGEIQDRNISKGTIYKKIKFRNNSLRSKKYSPYEIKGYKIGEVEFESLWFKEHTEFFIFNYYNRYGVGEKIFLRILKKGDLTCYYKEYIDSDSGYLVEREKPLFFHRANFNFIWNK